MAFMQPQSSQYKSCRGVLCSIFLLKSKTVFATMSPCTAEAQLNGDDRYANLLSQLNSKMRVDESISSSLT